MNQALDIPQDIEAEKALLGKLLEDNSVLSEVAVLKPEDFYFESHQHVFRAIKEQDSFDIITTTDKLKAFGKLDEIGGIQFLAELEACSPMQGNFEYYAKIIKDHSLLRNLISGCNGIIRECRDPKKELQSVLIDAEKLLTELSKESISKTSIDVKDAVTEYSANLEKTTKGGGKVGLPTGLFKLDQLISGLIAPDLVLIAAASGVGKTALALNMATKVGETGRVKIFSREMGHQQITGRLLSSISKVNNKALKTGNMTQEQWDSLSMGAGKLSEMNISIDDKTSHIDEAIHKTKQDYNKHGLDLVIFDYIQRFGSSGQTREQEIAKISSSLKNLAMDINVPVVGLSQLNRKVDERSDHIPQLSDLRESGALEHDSDIILLVYREDRYEEDARNHNGKAKIFIAKHRNGPTGMITCGYEGKHTTFYNTP